jgi:hypothetical protein
MTYTMGVLKRGDDVVFFNGTSEAGRVAILDSDRKVRPDAKALLESNSACAENLEIETAW